MKRWLIGYWILLVTKQQQKKNKERKEEKNEKVNWCKKTPLFLCDEAFSGVTGVVWKRQANN